MNNKGLNVTIATTKRTWRTKNVLSSVVMAALPTMKTGLRVLSRVEHVGNRKWLTCLKQSILYSSNGGTGRHDDNCYCERGMEDLVTC
jgi:hypothetical protein